jgi:hypothetical protein
MLLMILFNMVGKMLVGHLPDNLQTILRMVSLIVGLMLVGQRFRLGLLSMFLWMVFYMVGEILHGQKFLLL